MSEIDEIREIEVVDQTLNSVTVSCVFDYGEQGIQNKRITIPYTDQASIIRELREAYKQGQPAPADRKKPDLPNKIKAKEK